MYRTAGNRFSRARWSQLFDFPAQAFARDWLLMKSNFFRLLVSSNISKRPTQVLWSRRQPTHRSIANLESEWMEGKQAKVKVEVSHWMTFDVTKTCTKRFRLQRLESRVTCGNSTRTIQSVSFIHGQACRAKKMIEFHCDWGVQPVVSDVRKQSACWSRGSLNRQTLPLRTASIHYCQHFPQLLFMPIIKAKQTFES